MIWLSMALLAALGGISTGLPGYRLPGDVRPLHYIVEIKTSLEEPHFNFSGEVWIKVSTGK